MERSPSWSHPLGFLLVIKAGDIYPVLSRPSWLCWDRTASPVLCPMHVWGWRRLLILHGAEETEPGPCSGCHNPWAPWL